MSVRLRYFTHLNPSKTEAGDLTKVGNATFAPMEAIADGLGGLDTSLEKPAAELAIGSYSYFAEGDILLAKVTPCFENGKKALVSDLPNGIGFATSEVHVIRPLVGKIHPNFLRYLLSSEPFRAAGIASMTGAGGLKRVSENAIRDFGVQITDRETQRAIADFLDRETARIDQLVEKRSAFAELVIARRQSLVNAAVLGHAGVHSEWPGQVPQHWKAERAKFHFREAQARSEAGEEELLTVSHITGVTKRSDKDVNMFLAESNEGYKLVEPGDLVINTMWAWMGAMGVSSDTGLISPSYGVYRPSSNELLPQFIDLMVRSRPFIAEATRRSKGIHSSRLRLYPDAFLDMLLPIPTLSQQEAILRDVSERVAKEDALLSKNSDAEKLLREYRAALITAAVTGQIDVSKHTRTGDKDRRLGAIEAEMRA